MTEYHINVAFGPDDRLFRAKDRTWWKADHLAGHYGILAEAEAPPGGPYAVLRVALRNAILRLVGTRVPEVSEIYRAIERGELDMQDATAALEELLSEVALQKMHDWQAR